mmetsp:Transcript_28033/g.32151  ORF Transcript_28033/g.32151 Transcript_28033/m.32151 type:complete len:263 (+) Transcript_28033:23-811(+)
MEKNIWLQLKFISFRSADCRFGATFVVCDATAASQDYNQLLPASLKFHVVSCQMSFHYLCGSEESLRNFFSKMSQRLVPGGLFIGSCPNSNILVQRMRKAHRETGETTFGNSVYSVNFPSHELSDEKQFGHIYNFFLDDDCVGSREVVVGDDGKPKTVIHYVPEYLVYFPAIEKLAAEYGFRRIFKKNFHDFYDELRHDPKQAEYFAKKMFDEFGVSEFPQDQWEITHLYQAFAFQKQGTFQEPRQGEVSYDTEKRIHNLMD